MRAALLIILTAAAVHAQNYTQTIPPLSVPFVQGQHAVSSFNLYVGPGAGNLTSTAAENTGFGDDFVLANVTTGGANSAFGTAALEMVTSGTENTGIGTHAGKVITTGNNNTALGTDTLYSLATGSDNTAIGRFALYTATSSQNTAVGSSAMQLLTTGLGNTISGFAAGFGLTTGSFNTAMGWKALAVSQADNSNNAFGQYAGFGINGGHDNNTIGVEAGFGLTTGSKNTIIGNMIDTYAQVTTGSQNIIIGYDVSVASPTSNGQLDIGNYIYGTGLTGTKTTISPGAVGFGTKAPRWNVDVAGSFGITQYTPPSSSSPCTQGQIAGDASYLYECVAVNTWMRSALTAF